eukprot:6259193-Prymnesium_polylepis.1
MLTRTYAQITFTALPFSKLDGLRQRLTRALCCADVEAAARAAAQFRALFGSSVAVLVEAPRRRAHLA